MNGQTAQDLIKGALRRVNAYASGEPIQAPDANDALETLNDLLDSWSIDKQYIYGSNENIFTLQANQAQYTIGNPTNVDLGEPNIIGTLAGNSNAVNAPNVPADLALVSILSGNGIPVGTTVTAFNAGTITMSNNALSGGTISITYTVAGDFPIPRPNRITNAFTRFNQLDYTIEVTLTQSRFLEILYKAQPGPWPTVAWYNPLFPYGEINFYQTPGNNGELHLFTDTILQNLALNQVFMLPAGYSRALKWCLAKELCAEYGYPMSEAIKTHAAESLSMIKALNATPAAIANYDPRLIRPRANAGWIMNGGMG